MISNLFGAQTTYGRFAPKTRRVNRTAEMTPEIFVSVQCDRFTKNNDWFQTFCGVENENPTISFKIVANLNFKGGKCRRENRFADLLLPVIMGDRTQQNHENDTINSTTATVTLRTSMPPRHSRLVRYAIVCNNNVRR